MPVMKTQEIQCLECKEVLLAVMGERKTLVCSCEAVKVNVHSNYISTCLLYTSPSPRDATLSRMPSSA